MPTPKIAVRPASVADSASIAHVCLLTAKNGLSAEKFIRHPDLPSHVRALPYLHLPSGFCFVLVETTELEKEQMESIVGYVVGTAHPAQFEREVAASWWPMLKLKYPRTLIGTPLDRYYVDLIHKNRNGSSEASRSDIAHIHVNVTRKYKEYGCDSLLVDVALQHIRKRRYSR
ncbi:hypothetical protein DFH11DRAFT_1238888 [Phellopilus nigrolimitatus]|nr:hypothetical protein DFH11DRAFT_1238888 [Phellopilus nigrolimitatus]